MYEIKDMVRHIKNIPAKTPFPGVEERTLISPETVGSKYSVLKHYAMDSDTRFDYECAGEAVFYVICGEGIAIASLITYASGILLEAYVAFWVPPRRKGTISNTGEGPLRFLVASTTEKQERADMGTSRRDPTVTKRSESYLYPLTKSFGLEERHLFQERPFKYLGRTYSTEFQRYPQGSVQLQHHHTSAEQNMYVTRGHGKMLIDQKKRDIQAGTVIHIPTKLEHSLANAGNDFLDLFVMMDNVE